MVSALGRQKQESRKFKVIFDYILACLSYKILFLFLLLLFFKGQVVMAHPFNPRTWQADLGLQLGLQSEDQDSQGHPEMPCLGGMGS